MEHQSKMLFVLLFVLAPNVKGEDRPNLVFVITDDQGYGDLGFTGNPIIAANLRFNGEMLETKPVTDDDVAIRFIQKLTRGSHKFSPFFTVANGRGKQTRQLGGFYVTVSPVAEKGVDRSAFAN